MLEVKKYPKYVQKYLIKRFANHSNLTLMETNDSKRLEEFILLVSKKLGHIYCFDLKNGLSKALVANNIVNHNFVTDKNTLTGLEQRITSLNQAIDYYESQLELFVAKRQSSILIGNIDRVQPQEVSILRVLATERKYFDKEAHLALFVPSLDVFPLHLRSRAIEIEIELSTKEERRTFLKEIQSAFNLDGLTNEDQLIKQLAGLSLHDVNTVLLESIARTGQISLDIVSNFKEQVLKNNNLELSSKEEKGFSAIGGYDVVKEYIQKMVLEALRNRKKAELLNKELPKGILFFGSPGTGKSLFAKAIGKELELPVVELQTRHFLSKFVGESESNLKNALKIIDEMSPCVVFIDEIDALGSRSSQGEQDGGTMSRIFGHLLTWLNDQEDSIIIATTNEIERIDHAMLRAGRLDQIIPILLPDRKARKEILKVHATIKRKVPLGEIDFSKIAEQSEFFTGAELEALVKSAIDEAFIADSKKVTQKHFMTALENFSIDKTERWKQLQRYLEQARRFTRDKRFIKELEAGQKESLSRIELVKQKMQGAEEV